MDKIVLAKNISKTFKNEKLKKIVNVYKLHYRNGSSPGIGDYLRGCFALMQISHLLNIEFDLDVSQHPLSNFIENPISINGIDYNSVDIFDGLNCRDGRDNDGDVKENVNSDFLNYIISYLNNKNCEVFGLFSNTYPCFNYYSSRGKELIKSRLRPNKYMRDYVDETLGNLGLSKKGYGVIHIRSGDEYLLNKEKICSKFLRKIKNILKHFTFSDRRYLIISDCTLLKNELKSNPNFYIYLKRIVHLGGESLDSSEKNGIMNTMLDFFLMEHSNAILSLTVYNHVSGFSKYASIIHDIPFKYIKL